MDAAVFTARPATAADLGAIEALLRASGLPTGDVPALLAAHAEDFVVAESAGELVAVAGLEVCGPDALLRSVAVRPTWRGRGVGERLVRHLTAGADARGLRALYLLTTTAETWFPRLGFARVARDVVPHAVRATAEFRGACPASAAAMVRYADPSLRSSYRAPSQGRDAGPAARLHDAPGDAPLRVLVLCTGNSARSQIAEALLATRGAGRVAAASAGSRPAPRVNPYAIAVLAEHGIVWDGRAPKSLDDVAGEAFDLMITVCDNARDACPFVPGAAAQVHWGLPDPADVEDPAAARHAFAATYDALASRVDALLALPLETLPPAERRVHAQAVHDGRPGGTA